MPRIDPPEPQTPPETDAELDEQLPGWRRSADQRRVRVSFFFERTSAAEDLESQIRDLARERGVEAHFQQTTQVCLTTTLEAPFAVQPEALLALALSIDRLAAGEV